MDDDEPFIMHNGEAPEGHTEMMDEMTGTIMAHLVNNHGVPEASMPSVMSQATFIGMEIIHRTIVAMEAKEQARMN